MLLGLLAACGGDDAGGGTGAPATTGTSAATAPSRPAGVLRVPEDHPTIQAALDASVPGDLVLIGAGTYHEALVVSTPGISVRGIDRNEVVLDGEHDLGDGITVNADGVAIENLTVRNYRFNGVLFVPDTDEREVLTGYRASFVTAYDNGLYGLYAFRARDGLFEDSYASGHPDSGFYIGQCDPCEAVVRRVVAEGNVVGFQATNASGDLYVVESTWRANRVGIQPNSDTYEGEAPQHDATIVGNRVVDSGTSDLVPPSESGEHGYGIALGGTIDDVVERNLVTGNTNTGIALLGDNVGFIARGNRIAANVLAANGVDLEYVSPTGEANGNCFTGNTFAGSQPEAIEAVLPCDGPAGVVPPATGSQRVPSPPGQSHRTLPAPPAQPSMPDAATAPRRPATMPAIDLDAIAVPT